MIAQNQINKIFFQIYKTNYLLMYRSTTRNVSRSSPSESILKKGETMLTDKEIKDGGVGGVGGVGTYLNKKKIKPHRFFLKSEAQVINDNLQSATKEEPYVAKGVGDTATGTGTGAGTKLTMYQGLQEFLQHPMTWDRNNGFINLVLGLALFGYCFCATCDDSHDSKYQKKK